MERIVEDEWMEMETSEPIEFATDNFEIIGMFSRKLNRIAQEANRQEVQNTIDRYRAVGRFTVPEPPKHSGGMLFPGDMIYAYNCCVSSDKPVYLVMSNLCVQYTAKDSYNWKRELERHINITENGCVRGFYEYRNIKDGDRIACMRELSLEEITEIINN